MVISKTIAAQEVGTLVPGFHIDGTTALGNFGLSIASGFFDFNGDKIADILIGTPSSNKNGGTATVIYGRCGAFPPMLTNAQVPNVETIFAASVPFINFGSSVASAGDINGDGITDILVGSSYAENHRGDTFVIFSC